MVYTLEILPENEEVKSWYESRSNFSSDAGVDLYIPEDLEFNLGETKFVNLKIKCRMLNSEGNTVSYYLYPRSSISKTPLILANHVGIIDADYRGSCIAALRYIPNETDLYYISTCHNIFLEKYDDPIEFRYNVDKKSKLVQICSPILEKIQIKLVDSLDETERGEGGFGSTNS